MTREHAQKLLPVIMAFVNGLRVEVKMEFNKWEAKENFGFDSEIQYYRIVKDTEIITFDSSGKKIINKK